MVPYKVLLLLKYGIVQGTSVVKIWYRTRYFCCYNMVSYKILLLLKYGIVQGTSVVATTEVPCTIPYFISLKMTPNGSKHIALLIGA